jgi:hypothetical protein
MLSKASRADNNADRYRGHEFFPGIGIRAVIAAEVPV